MPTSKDINHAIDTLCAANLDAEILHALDTWNAERLVAAAAGVKTLEDFQTLFAGLSGRVLNEAGVT